MKKDDELVPDLAESTIAAATGGLGLIPVALRRTIPAVKREWQQNASRCLAMAATTAGMSRVDLDAAIAADPSRVSLTVRALHYAGMNGADEALLTMGVALGSSITATTDTAADDAALIVEAARNLTPRHVHVLRVLRQERQTKNGGSAGWSREEVPEATGLSVLAAGAVLDSCTTAGTVTASSGFGALVYRTSELGVEVLRILEHVSKSTS